MGIFRAFSDRSELYGILNLGILHRKQPKRVRVPKLPEVTTDLGCFDLKFLTIRSLPENGPIVTSKLHLIIFAFDEKIP